MFSFWSGNMDTIGLSTDSQTPIFWFAFCLLDKIIIVFTMGTSDVIYLGINERTRIGSLISSNNVITFGV